MPRRKAQANEIPAKLPDKDKSSKDKSKRKQKSEEYLKYQKYIRSKEFQLVKDAVFERDNHQCQVCNWCPDDYDPNLKSTHRNLSCHHRTYDNLYNELEHLEDCITLCTICHANIHRAPSNFSRFKNKPK